ncbi:YceI family protein [Rapidithrix thailandica]|uniref:YceI family protein n=1 Tax=Rapidithrix thailandica TaxID=413964 RepID=A0AAW9S451_9BACT
MKTNILMLLVLVVSCMHSFAQSMEKQTMIDRNGTTSFFSVAPLENIVAVNNQVLAAINLQKGTVAVSMLMRGFRFKKTLMEEHFNENYVESDKYPKATFQGTIKDFTLLPFDQNGSFEAVVEGEVSLHGVTQPLSTEVQFTLTDKFVQASTTFELVVADFEIKIPQLVVNNIAKKVEVQSRFNFSKKK